ncbi:BBE domain-containing protein [Streptomyces acidiscabies]|uniref:Berberine/berberine-like domain-containing protein n=1 Tax=Streptomyces acidiscabies TaxID=42234 RepID=A0A0L0JKM8_9ACTN|nr:BBE domain-containing protein [Streptomyces acidiscabies]KND26158.1 hypothetical protein IQ63_38680 [Streptomyces acidiscabies]
MGRPGSHGLTRSGDDGGLSSRCAGHAPAPTNAYTNLTQDQSAEWRRGVWGGEAKYRRLRELKAEWDPRNLLRFNKNIEPAAPSASIRR